eukprot:TRINITY_DN12539_c0_g1_i5.p1 TRINITY_DN12539_c0_g1~~TRINITY_DN12539_c0_g1_i5.p1  ORF type:complete len:586 (-),score=73.15 TRINITY_DN12539_c0_g1_i5:355-2112(-)
MQFSFAKYSNDVRGSIQQPWCSKSIILKEQNVGKAQLSVPSSVINKSRTRLGICRVQATAIDNFVENIPQTEEKGLQQQQQLQMEQAYKLEHQDWQQNCLSVVVVGGSGDLAKKKIFPSLFALFYEGMLPENIFIYGYARSNLDDEEFKERILSSLTCRIDSQASCEDLIDKFLDRCFYHKGQYDCVQDFRELDKVMSQREAKFGSSNRMFYLSIPPNVFVAAAAGANAAASSNGWTRVVVEKPFGKDLGSYLELKSELSQHLTEEQIYRIDHYLGKELIENILVLRFSNLVFEPLWSRQQIQNVQVIFSEDFGTEGRGGYFDQYGIIRDVLQNHLLQIVALFAMEAPVSLDAEDVRDEKVKVLKNMKVIDLEDVVVGQYKAAKGQESYTDDKTVPEGSITPTFAAMALFIDNARWDGVPFLLKAGKALHSRHAEIRVQFRSVPGNLYKQGFGVDLDRNTNELVIRIQPKEGIYLKVNNKVPGLGLKLHPTALDLTYKSRYQTELPDAYERLILDVINGDKRLFIRDDELEAAWKLFTPVLEHLEEHAIAPELYPYGSRGPLGAHYLAAKHSVKWGDLEEDLQDV